jgi:hypothetical protein
MAEQGDAKLTDLLATLADLPEGALGRVQGEVRTKKRYERGGDDAEVPHSGSHCNWRRRELRGGSDRGGHGPGMDDPSTWRWQVNAILTEQSATVSRPAAERDFTGEADARGEFAAVSTNSFTAGPHLSAAPRSP